MEKRRRLESVTPIKEDEEEENHQVSTWTTCKHKKDSNKQLIEHDKD